MFAKIPLGGGERNPYQLIDYKAPKLEAIFSPVCYVPVRFAVNINKTTLSITLNTILYSTGHITQQQ